MFADSIVEEKLARFAKEFGWKPTPHSIEEVDRATKSIGTAFEIDSKGTIFQTRSLSKAETRFVSNERALCAASCFYFLTRYYWIKTKSRIVRFSFRQGQWILWRMLQELDALGVSKLLQILKARQLGISTLAEGIMTWGALFIPGVAAQIGSADGQKTQIMLGMMTLAIDQLPPWLPPTQTRSKTASDRALLEFSRVGSLIMVQPGSIRGGMGQGSTPTMVHLCLSPNTKIRSEEGSVKRIGDLVGREKALAGDGELSVVSALTLSHRQREMTAELTPWGYFEPQSTTLDHPVLTPAGMRSAGELKKGDDVAYAVREIGSLIPESDVWHRPCGKTRRTWKTTAFHNFDLGWICGLYIAEGHIRLGKSRSGGCPRDIIFAQHEKEVERNTAGLRRVFKTETITLKRRPDSKTCTLHFYSGGWAKWMLANFGRTTEKHIPDWVFLAGREFCEGLLAGYLEGDGHIPKEKAEIFATTIREGVAHQLRELTASLGYGWPCMYHREGGVFYNRNCQPTWTLMWSGEMASRMRERNNWPRIKASKALHWRYSPDGKHVYVQLKKAERGFSEKFYDVEVAHPGHVFHTAQMAVKNSEVSQYTNPVQQLDEGLFKALHEGPELVVMLESTGDASHNSAWWWKEQWEANRDNYWAGRARFLPVFLPWHTTPELYPGEAWLKKFPMPDGWSPNDDTLTHIHRAEAYVHSTEMLRRVMGETWTMPRTQQWYWEFNHEDHKRRRVEKSWYRQMPCDDYEALLGERDKVASDETVEVISASVAKYDSVRVYMLAGDGVEAKREPPESRVWYGEDSPPRIRFHWDYQSKASRKMERLDWMLVPMAREHEKVFDPLEKILIYEEPREGFDYSCGADTGTGVGGDRTVLTVTRFGTDAEPDVQVCEFASDSIPASEIYAWISALNAYYSKVMTWRPHPKIAIEMKRKFGDLPYHQTKLLGFRRWHEWGHGFDKKTFEDKVGKHGRIGWFTNEWSRPLLLSAFLSAVENGWYVVRSKWLAEEIKNLEQRVTASGKTRVDHEAGEHDDRVFAAAMSYFTLHQSDVFAERAQKRYAAPEGGKIQIIHGPAEMLVTVEGGRLWQ